MRKANAAAAQDTRFTKPTRSQDEIARLGDEIYERDIRQLVQTDHDGDIVAIDVDSGGWAISGDLMTAAGRLRAQHSQAVNVWSLRVGSRAVYKFGGGRLRGVQ